MKEKHRKHLQTRIGKDGEMVLRLFCNPTSQKGVCRCGCEEEMPCQDRDCPHEAENSWPEETID